MNDIVCNCFTTAKLYIFPLNNFTQQTNNQPSRKQNEIPHKNVITKEKVIV